MTTLREYLSRGWEIKHDPGTAFVSLVHPKGGAMSLVEVHTGWHSMTLGQADEVAKEIAELLANKYSEGGEPIVNCSRCGKPMTEVRPGKYQCDHLFHDKAKVLERMNATVVAEEDDDD